MLKHVGTCRNMLGFVFVTMTLGRLIILYVHMSLNWLNEGDFNQILITASNAQHSSWRLLLFFFN